MISKQEIVDRLHENYTSPAHSPEALEEFMKRYPNMDAQTTKPAEPYTPTLWQIIRNGFGILRSLFG